MQSRGNKTRLIDKVYDAICESIACGKVNPGDWLRQETLATELGVSQVTVRDALNKLVMEGLAERVPRKGVRIPLVSAEDVKDIYEMRLIAEGLAWEAAAAQITAEELQQMRDLLPFTVTSADPASVNTARRNNKEFHMIAIRASRRWTLIHLATSLLNFNNLRHLLFNTTEAIRIKDGAYNFDAHTRLLQALEARDGVRARELVMEHIRVAMTDRLELAHREEKG